MKRTYAKRRRGKEAEKHTTRENWDRILPSWRPGIAAKEQAKKID